MFHIKDRTTKTLLAVTGTLVLLGLVMIGTGLYYGTYLAGFGLVLSMTSLMLFVGNLLHDDNFLSTSVSEISQGRNKDVFKRVS